jgi:hypothetical protein
MDGLRVAILIAFTQLRFLNLTHDRNEREKKNVPETPIDVARRTV